MGNEMRRESAKYRRLNWLLLAGMFVYVAVAVERESEAGREELFPFASWSLFTTVPNVTTDYSLRVRAVEGAALDEPVWFEQAGHLFADAKNHSAYQSVQTLGRAFDRGDAAGVKHHRRHVERMFLTGRGQVEYQLVRRRADPLDRYRAATFISLHPLADYTRVPPPDSTPRPAAVASPSGVS